jgi:5-oxoprolinase (ATP-hydrolysing)
MSAEWQFWIDVGGTFTDCIARRLDGLLVTHKLLSSGVYKGIVGAGSTRQMICDAGRSADPPGFFDGFRLTLLSHTQCHPTQSLEPMDQDVPVARFDASRGTLELARPLAAEPEPGMRYELASAEHAPITGIRWLMAKRLDDEIGPVEVRLGTTRGTNALLERQGAKTALVTTAGFRDVLRIAYQNRPRLFDLEIRLPSDLYIEVVELNERLDKDGLVLKPIDESEAHRKLSELRARGVVAVAVCLLHSYRNATHELVVEKIAHELGFEQVSVSSRLSPLQKLVARGDTTVVDAYLTPIIRDYVARIAAKIPHGSLKLMTSAGALVDASRFVGKDSILSGPAGGVVGYAHVAQAAGFQRAIGFDMGGTSTDVSRFDGEYERRYEMEVNDPKSGRGVRVVAPMLAIETVAAGGGSICWFDGQKPVVGPRSAAADPGPACYGRGGPLTVTDVNLYLGKILTAYFPFPLDRSAVELRLDEAIAAIARATGQRYNREQLATGFTAIANANMIAPIKRISIARGYDPREYTLVSFGGAGAQHACAIARELGIRSILLHRLAGVLSAFGIGMAEVTKFAERAVGRRYESSRDGGAHRFEHDIEPVFHEMLDALRTQILAEGIPRERIRPPRRLLDLRYAGQDTCITVPRPEDGDYRRAFERQHRQLYGFTFPNRAVEVHAARMELVGETDKPACRRHPVHPQRPKPRETTRTYFANQYLATAVYLRDDLRPGAEVMGPAIIIESISTIVVEPDWRAIVTENDDVVLEALSDEAFHRSTLNAQTSQPARQRSTLDTSTAQTPRAAPDAITLELFNNHFASIAEQMGATLQKTALSTNVKERLDFSCAIFTADGDLVVNAPHIPVHLGAMSECVKCLIEDVPQMRPGEVYVTNDPFRGGSHLPDVTVVTPVFSTPLSDEALSVERQEGSGFGVQASARALGVETLHVASPNGSTPQRLHSQHLGPQRLFFTASRAHHAEIGGITPGSMPPFSKSLADEGVLIRHFRLVRQEQSSEQALEELLSAGPHPSRSVHENIADINAQVAANQVGVGQLVAMVERYGLDTVQAYMGHIQRAAENKMRAALAKIPEGEHEFTDAMDDGSRISVRITVRHVEQEGRAGGEAIVDFAGTGPVSAGNLNANRAIVSSAVIYCFRCLIDEAIPLNAGILAPITICLPENCLLNPPTHAGPSQCPAVVGGNVETSQRVVDCIFGALRVAAASQGTMNNFIFGRSKTAARPGFGYYETICGGAGAGPTWNGADAVHTHMTNTRLTDPEVLEDRYPVRLRRFEIRRGSGGTGRHKGGDGIVREIEFLEALEVSLLTSRRSTRPYGLEGGAPGAPGRNRLTRAGSEKVDELPGAAQLRVQAGDILRIETPGGGGCGTAT